MPITSGGKVIGMTLRARRELAKELQDNRQKPYGHFAAERGCSVALIKKVAREFSIKRR
jgi:uncharacterized protein YerC